MDKGWNILLACLDQNTQSYGNRWDDHITLHAAENLYIIEIHVVFTIGYAVRPITQTEFEPITRFYLSNFAEGQGEHYVVLNKAFWDNSENELETYYR